MRTAAQGAIVSVRDCGAQMGASAHALRTALPSVRMDEGARNRTLDLCEQLSAVAGEVASGVAGLNEVSARSDDEVREVLHTLSTLSTLEAQMMQALAGFSGLVESLEQAGERDEANEPAYVLVIDAAAGLLQSFQKARSSTEALRAALSRRRQ